MLPGLKSRILPKYIRKIIHINGKHGKRLMNHELYTHLRQQLFVDLVCDVIRDADDAEIVLVRGGPMRRALQKQSRMQADCPA